MDNAEKLKTVLRNTNVLNLFSDTMNKAEIPFKINKGLMLDIKRGRIDDRKAKKEVKKLYKNLFEWKKSIGLLRKALENIERAQYKV